MITIKNLSKRYGDRSVLSDFSMILNDREKVAIMGESGRGKTTLLRIIAGLEQYDAGTVSGVSKDDVAYVFQEPRLFDSISVIKNLTIVSNQTAKDAEQKAKELLESVGLLADASKYPNELSGGMKQRLALARAFMVDRSVLLLDEPFSALDNETREDMISFVKNRIQDKSVILVTHEPNDALALCDRIEYLA